MKWVSKRVRVITSRAPESGEDETDNDCEVDTLALVHPYSDEEKRKYNGTRHIYGFV